MANLTTLAPDIVAAILDDALPDHLTLFDIAVDPPAVWEEQRRRIGHHITDCMRQANTLGHRKLSHLAVSFAAQTAIQWGTTNDDLAGDDGPQGIDLIDQEVEQR
jgi:hypothetical protein